MAHVPREKQTIRITTSNAAGGQISSKYSMLSHHAFYNFIHFSDPFWRVIFKFLKETNSILRYKHLHTYVAI